MEGNSEDQNSSLDVCVLSRFSRVQLLVTPWTVAHRNPLSMGFPRQEYWSGLPFPTPGDLPNPGIELECLMSPYWQAGSLPPAWMIQYKAPPTVLSLTPMHPTKKTPLMHCHFLWCFSPLEREKYFLFHTQIEKFKMNIYHI